MCGRYLRRSDKQRIAEAFHIGMDLSDLCLEPEDDIAPRSIQPVVLAGEAGDRELALMPWGFKLPGRLLFNARAEGIDQVRFWKDSFEHRRCIVPANAIFEWSQVEKGKKKPKYAGTIPGREPFAMAGLWKICRRKLHTSAYFRFLVVFGGTSVETSFSRSAMRLFSASTSSGSVCFTFDSRGSTGFAALPRSPWSGFFSEVVRIFCIKSKGPNGLGIAR